MCVLQVCDHGFDAIAIDNCTVCLTLLMLACSFREFWLLLLGIETTCYLSLIYRMRTVHSSGYCAFIKIKEPLNLNSIGMDFRDRIGLDNYSPVR